MKVAIKKYFAENGRSLIRKCGYGEIFDRRSGSISYSKRIGNYHYPRFHVYINQEKPGYIVFDLHLDEKKQSYEGHKAHSAQADSQLVQDEDKRIRSILEPLGSDTEVNSQPEEQPLWKKMFGKKN